MIDLTCTHPLRHFGTLDRGRYIAHCTRCDHVEWDTDEWSGGTLEQALDIYEGYVIAEARADQMNSPQAIAFAARYLMARIINTASGRRSLAEGMWIAVHPTRFKATGTTSEDCAQTFTDARLYVIPPHLWRDAVDKLFDVWTADQRDAGRGA